MANPAQLSPDILISAYCQGYFPMADDDGSIYWYDPNPRAIIPLETFRVGRRLARTIRNGGFETRFDTAFEQVVRACAAPRHSSDSSWISDDIIRAYTELHRHGFAHSVETWRDGVLVGGLYGVAIRGLFAGESMFSRERDASKVAYAALVQHLRGRGYTLLDSQFINDHMASLGAIEIPREQYKQRLAAALSVHAMF